PADVLHENRQGVVQARVTVAHVPVYGVEHRCRAGERDGRSAEMRPHLDDHLSPRELGELLALAGRDTARNVVRQLERFGHVGSCRPMLYTMPDEIRTIQTPPAGDAWRICSLQKASMRFGSVPQTGGELR